MSIETNWFSEQQGKKRPTGYEIMEFTGLMGQVDGILEGVRSQRM